MQRRTYQVANGDRPSFGRRADRWGVQPFEKWCLQKRTKKIVTH